MPTGADSSAQKTESVRSPQRQHLLHCTNVHRSSLPLAPPPTPPLQRVKRFLRFHGNNLLRLRRGSALRLGLRRRGRDAAVGVRDEQRPPLPRSFVALGHAEPAKTPQRFVGKHSRSKSWNTNGKDQNIWSSGFFFFCALICFVVCCVPRRWLGADARTKSGNV